MEIIEFILFCMFTIGLWLPGIITAVFFYQVIMLVYELIFLKEEEVEEEMVPLTPTPTPRKTKRSRREVCVVSEFSDEFKLSTPNFGD